MKPVVLKKTLSWKEAVAKGLLLLAIASLAVSIFLPYWCLKVVAPQYPKGLSLCVYLNRVEGDVGEIDLLNHYIGMQPMEAGGRIERKISFIGVSLILACLAAAVVLRKKISLWLVLPGIFFPVVFIADLYLWLRHFGLHLNPHAPLSLSVKPFVPKIFGEGKVAQFYTSAHFPAGYQLCAAAAILIVLAMGLRFWKKRGPAAPLSAALFFFVVGSASPAFAKTIVVAPAAPAALQTALDAAENGDTVVVKPGLYAGPIAVRKSVRLEGENFPVIDGGGHGSVVLLEAPDIVFRGFVVRGSGDLLSGEHTGILASGSHILIENNRLEDVLFGIYLRQSSKSEIRGNTLASKPLDLARRGDLIRVWYSNDVVIEGNRAAQGRDVVLWFSKNIRVLGNELRDSRYGLHFMYCENADVEKNRCVGNSVGAYLMYSADLKLRENIFSENRGPSGYGIGFKDMQNALIEGNLVAGNRVGFFLDDCFDGLCRRNAIAYNDVGMQMLPTARHNRFLENNWVENGEQVLLEGPSVFTVNQWQNNYWSDYRGYDLNQDGIGDIPHQPMRLFERLTDRFHGLKIFQSSPSIYAIDFAAATFPIFAPAPKFVDPHPRVRPVPFSIEIGKQTASGAWLLSSLILLLPAGGFFFLSPLRPVRGSPSLPVPPANPAAAVRVRGLTKRFKKLTALSNLDLEIQKGEGVALWGPNGAGKTTLLRCLLGIIPFEGEAEVMGMEVRRNGKEARRLIGYVPQEIRLHLDQTVWETVCFYARLRGVSRERAQMLIQEWGLEPAKKQLAQNLSGGMKQKLALVIALLSNPPILFLDEPASNLDIKTREELDVALERLKQAGKTVIFCSHRFREVRRIADRMVMLEAGRKTLDGKPEEIRSQLKQQPKERE